MRLNVCENRIYKINMKNVFIGYKQNIKAKKIDFFIKGEQFKPFFTH